MKSFMKYLAGMRGSRPPVGDCLECADGSASCMTTMAQLAYRYGKASFTNSASGVVEWFLPPLSLHEYGEY